MTTTAVVRITTSQPSYFPLEEVEIRLDFLSTSVDSLKSFTGYRTLIPKLYFDELPSGNVKKENLCYYTMNPQLAEGEMKLNQLRICFYGLVTANPSWIVLEDSKISYSHIPKKRNSRLLLCSMPKNLVVGKIVHKKKKLTFWVKFSLPGTDSLPPSYKGTNFRVKYALSLEMEMLPFGGKIRTETYHIPIQIKNPIASFRRVLTSGKIFDLKFVFTTHMKKQSLKRKVIESPEYQNCESEIMYHLSQKNGVGHYQIRCQNQEIGVIVVPKLGYRIGEDIQVIFQVKPKRQKLEEEEEESDGGEEERKKEIKIEKNPAKVRCVGVKCSLVCLERVFAEESLRVKKSTYEGEIGRKVLCTESRVLMGGEVKVGFCFKANNDEACQFKTDIFENVWILAFSFWVQNDQQKGKKSEMKWALPIFVYPETFIHGKTVSSSEEYMIV